MGKPEDEPYASIRWPLKWGTASHANAWLASIQFLLGLNRIFVFVLSSSPYLIVVRGQLILNQLFGNETKPEICKRNKETGGAYLSDLSLSQGRFKVPCIVT